MITCDRCGDVAHHPNDTCNTLEESITQLRIDAHTSNKKYTLVNTYDLIQLLESLEAKTS